MRQATRTQWIKCTIAILLYLAFLIWVRSWWGLIVVPWVDAIVFALVAVNFVNIYIFQNYQIPSSSLV